MTNWLKYGLIYGLISIILFLLSNYMLETGLGMQSLFALIVVVGISITVAREEKASNGGFLSYGKALKIIFLTLMVGALISVLFMGLMISVIDPSLAEVMAEQGLGITQSMMEMFGVPDDIIEKAMADAEDNMDGAMSFSNLLANLPFTFIMNLIYAAIISLFVKKNNPKENEYL